MRSKLPRGWDRNPVEPREPGRRRRLTIVLLAATSAAILAFPACGDGDEEDVPTTVTGRVMSIDAARYCVSPDRGESRMCVVIPDPMAVEGVDVGACVTTTSDLTSEGAKVVVVAEAACAAGDLGA
ncbi:MAG TPA: hypothetical protein VM143_17135 [Acidimicrobiales bacterium]|nr:hypothetical protein [Acidimicrobiales bacterium]